MREFKVQEKNDEVIPRVLCVVDTIQGFEKRAREWTLARLNDPMAHTIRLNPLSLHLEFQSRAE